jgi:hypothetical protein
MIKLEFRNVEFCGGRKTREPGEKHRREARERINNKLNSHMMPLESKSEITSVRGKRLTAMQPMLPKNV